jgi:hypothetical protein
LDRLGHIRIEDDGRSHGVMLASRLLLLIIEMSPGIWARVGGGGNWTV